MRPAGGCVIACLAARASSARRGGLAVWRRGGVAAWRRGGLTGAGIAGKARSEPVADPKPSIFRAEAVEHHARPEREGDVLRISPAWVQRSYMVLVSVVVASVAYAALGRVHEYSVGPALVVINGRTDVATTSVSVVASVLVRSGQVVAAGDPLARVYSEQGIAELERINRQVDPHLGAGLAGASTSGDPDLPPALRIQRELAESRLAVRTLFAPHAGVVSDVRVRPGQRLAAGEAVASVIDPDARFSIVALLPGHDRPALRQGLPLRLELQGWRYTYLEVPIASIGETVMGPSEARRYLSRQAADTIPFDGPVVVVHARLPRRTFDVDGGRFNFYDGMPVRAEARVRTERIAFALFPALRAVFHRSMW
jgi:membrane fusion protein (multidrug efflux system)